MNTSDQNLKPSAIRLAVSLFATQKTVVLGFTACLIGVVGCELAIPYLLQQAVDTALEPVSDKLYKLNIIGALMALVVFLLYLIHVGYLRLETILLYAGIFKLRKWIYEHVLRQPISYFHRKKSGELIHHVTSDTNEYRDAANKILSDLPFESLTVVGVITLMFVTNVELAAVVLTFVVIAAYISYRIGEPLPSLTKLIQRSGSRMTSKLQELFSGIRTVKSFNRIDNEVGHLDRLNDNIIKHQRRGGIVHSFLNPIFDLIEMLGVIFIVWFGARLLVQDSITPGGLIAFIAYMELLAEPMGKAGDHLENWLKLKAISERIYRFLDDTETDTHTRKQLKLDDTLPTYPVVFDHLTYFYPDTPKPALKHIHFRVETGEIVALTGANGSGKSTLMDLLLGLNEPASGHIYIDGLDNCKLHTRHWMEQIGILSQDVFLFHASVAENIAYGKTDASTQAILLAAEQAGLGSLIDKLPKGLNTVVGDRGSKLSGGEKQKIALARLFLKQPKIIILDEPTSAFDRVARNEFAGLLQKLTQNRTTFIISHHEEILQLADRVITLHNGRLIEDRRQNKISLNNEAEAAFNPPKADVIPFEQIAAKTTTLQTKKARQAKITEEAQAINAESSPPKTDYAQPVFVETISDEIALSPSITISRKRQPSKEIAHTPAEESIEEVPSYDIHQLFNAANRGNADAQNQLGLMHEIGVINGDSDFQAAAYWYSLAAAQGNPDAENNLKGLNKNGKHIKIDKLLVFKRHHQLASQGDKKAQNIVALMYLRGLGVDKDVRQAQYWLESAARLGHIKAMYNLGVLYEDGTFTKRDLYQAKYWYQKASEAGHAFSRKRLIQIAKNETTRIDAF